MRIGVLSDTHVPERALRLPQALFEAFHGVELILHAGDIVRMSVLDELSAIAPVAAVRGNMDDPAHGLPLKIELTLEGVSVGLIHGNGGPRHNIREHIAREFHTLSPINTLPLEAGINKGRSGHDIRYPAACRRELHHPRVIVYGHTHEAFWGQEKGIWFFNPGSPTDAVVAKYRSAGILTLDSGTIRGEIIRL
jgi:predicted phosphodiesterase